jgi:hypothetical protein
MRMTRRHLAPNEVDHELIWLSVSLGSLGLAAAWFALGLPWPWCAFHAVTGLPCLTCGMTRSAIQFFHGHFLAALRWNPLVFTFLCTLSIFDAYAVAVIVTRSPRLRIAHFTSQEKTLVRGLVATLLAINWIYLLAHWRRFS